MAKKITRPKPRINELQFGTIYLKFNVDGSIDLTFSCLGTFGESTCEVYEKGKVAREVRGKVMRIVPGYPVE